MSISFKDRTLSTMWYEVHLTKYESFMLKEPRHTVGFVKCLEVDTKQSVIDPLLHVCMYAWKLIMSYTWIRL